MINNKTSADLYCQFQSWQQENITLQYDEAISLKIFLKKSSHKSSISGLNFHLHVFSVC